MPCLGGRKVKKLVAALQDESDRLGQPPPKAPNDDPCRIVSLTLEYIKTNAHRMNWYPVSEMMRPYTALNGFNGCHRPLARQ